MIWLNVGCGPHRAPKPWMNLDCHEDDTVRPDYVVDALTPVKVWQDQTVDRIYLGHVLEHVPWDRVPSFLADVKRALRPDGWMCVVGPDVFRTIRLWAAGHPQVPESKILEVMECYEHFQPAQGWWFEARHHWNCFEQRVSDALGAAGFTRCKPIPVDPTRPHLLEDWPLVSFMPDQCCVVAQP